MPSQRILEILKSDSCPQACDISPLPIPPGVPALECLDLRFSYHDGVEAVAGVGFQVKAGEAVALCGPNGSGKTTLLKLLTGLLQPQSGTIRLAGRELKGDNAGQAFRSVGLLFQDSQDQLFCNNVLEDVSFGLKNLGLESSEVQARASLALHLAEAEHLKGRPIHHLSGGEMKRVALAGLIAMRTPVIILDEPTAGLDPAATGHLMELVQHLHRDHGYALLVVTHEMDLVPRLADRVLVMREGRVVADGPSRQVLTDVPLLEGARLKPPEITKYFFQKALQEGRRPEWLPLSVEEALLPGKAGRNGHP